MSPINYFPYENIRNEQINLIDDIYNIIKEKKHAIIHAPTGLGKTVAVLAPAIAFAQNKQLKIFFLTSRHTQHRIVIETIKEINKKFNIKINVADIVGKKFMCIVPGIENLNSGLISEYCKKQKEDGLCVYYNKTKDKNKFTTEAKLLIDEIKLQESMHAQEIKNISKLREICPYEIAIALANKADVIACDYHHIFNDVVRENLFGKINSNLANSIIIVDEGHNLPLRIKDLMSTKISTFSIKRAVNEAKKLNYLDTADAISNIYLIFEEYSKKLSFNNEIIIDKDDFLNKVKAIRNIDTFLMDLNYIGDEILVNEKQSSVKALASFIENWKKEDIGFVRIFSKFKESKGYELSYRCLDPSTVSKEIIDKSYSTILLSGTLTPTIMYRDILGFPKESISKEYKSPFPVENRSIIIVPKTSTKYDTRSEKQYEEIAEYISDISNKIPGNVAVFFPSYYIRTCIDKYLIYKLKKTTFYEDSNLSKEEKEEMLEKFKKYKKNGAVLLGVLGGSFSEGIDLPNVMSGVIVVGLPFSPPNIETKKTIEYYDKKFYQGWNYAYIYPAINKCIQGLGRAIRNEKDKAFLVLLDERFALEKYRKCLPIDWKIDITTDYEKKIKEFFN